MPVHPNPIFTEKELKVIKNLATIRVNNNHLHGKCMLCKDSHPNEECSVSIAEGVVEKLKDIK